LGGSNLAAITDSGLDGSFESSAGDVDLDVSRSDAAATEGSTDAGPPPPIQVEPDGGVGTDAGTVVGLTVSPTSLTPSFSPSIHDYYVVCTAAEGNSLTVGVRYGSGSQSYSLDVAANQAVVVAGQYWIRCLPPDFPPITVTTNADAGGPTPGYYLVNSSAYAIILDTNGVPVWYERGTTVVNVDSPAVDTLTFMPSGTAPFGTSPTAAFDLLALDTLTRTTVVSPDGPTDPHEFQTLANGDHLIFTYPILTDVDLTGLGSFSTNQKVADCKIEEVDPTGRLVWSWDTVDHVDPVKESLEPFPFMIGADSVIDVFHCNSIDVDPSGNLLVSLRETNALYYVSRSTGKVLWKLGGTTHNKDGAALLTLQGDPETTFAMQHDARFQPNGDVTLFDDHGAPKTTGVARGVEYAIDVNGQTASFVWQFLGKGQSAYEGSFRRYADGHSVIGWGYVPTDPRVITEVDSNGNDVFDVAFSGMMSQTYRAVKVPLSQFDIDVLRRTTAQ
jgi:hypothetical protein